MTHRTILITCQFTPIQRQADGLKKKIQNFISKTPDFKFEIHYPNLLRTVVISGFFCILASSGNKHKSVCSFFSRQKDVDFVMWKREIKRHNCFNTY